MSLKTGIVSLGPLEGHVFDAQNDSIIKEGAKALGPQAHMAHWQP